MTYYRVLQGSPLSIVKQQANQIVGRKGFIGIRVKYAGVNRIDLLQKKGRYPLAEKWPRTLGLEVSGTVEKSVSRGFPKGSRVMALVQGGGYSDFVIVEECLCLPVPETLPLEKAAGIPETWITAFQLIQLTGTKKGDSVLIHAGAGGVGTALIQLVKRLGAGEIIVVCGSAKKEALAKRLGATLTVSRTDSSELSKKILAKTNQKGVSVIFDCVGASMFPLHVAVSQKGCRWVNFGLLGGSLVAKVNLSDFLTKHVRLEGSTLRSRSLEYRAKLIQEFGSEVLPEIASEKLQVIIDSVFPWHRAEDAHAYMAQNRNLGKIILQVD